MYIRSTYPSPSMLLHFPQTSVKPKSRWELRYFSACWTHGVAKKETVIFVNPPNPPFKPLAFSCLMGWMHPLDARFELIDADAVLHHAWQWTSSTTKHGEHIQEHLNKILGENRLKGEQWEEVGGDWIAHHLSQNGRSHLTLQRSNENRRIKLSWLLFYLDIACLQQKRLSSSLTLPTLPLSRWPFPVWWAGCIHWMPDSNWLMLMLCCTTPCSELLPPPSMENTSIYPAHLLFLTKLPATFALH